MPPGSDFQLQTRLVTQPNFGTDYGTSELRSLILPIVLEGLEKIPSHIRFTVP